MVEVARSIIFGNDGPFVTGSQSVASFVGLEKAIVFHNNDRGIGPTDEFWDGTGVATYRVYPAFCDAAGGDYRLYAFSPASAPVPPYVEGYFGERIGAHDVGCVPPAVVTATASPAMTNNPSLVITCPQGDFSPTTISNLVVSVDLNGPIMRSIDKTEVTLEIQPFAASAVRVFDESGYIEAGSDAIDTSYATTLTHRHFGGCGSQSVDVLLNGVPLAQKATFAIRTPDFNGNGVAADAVDFGYFTNGYPVNPAVNDCRDFNNDGKVDVIDFTHYSPHYEHTNPYSPANAPSKVAQSNAGVALRFTEEYPTATSHRLYVDVDVENFADVTISQFAMAPGNQRLSFVEWREAENSLGLVLLAPILRDGEPQLFFGTKVSESFNESTSHLGQLVFDVAGTEPFEVTDDDFVLAYGEILSGDAGGVGVVAQMSGVMSRTLDTTIARVYHNRLEQNFPNPFNPTTTLAYSLKDGGNVNLTIYDVAGRRVRELVNERRDRGAYRVTWDGQNDSGQIVASGVYFYKLIAGSFTDTKKMTILK